MGGRGVSRAVCAVSSSPAVNLAQLLDQSDDSLSSCGEGCGEAKPESDPCYFTATYPSSSNVQSRGNARLLPPRPHPHDFPLVVTQHQERGGQRKRRRPQRRRGRERQAPGLAQGCSDAGKRGHHKTRPRVARAVYCQAAKLEAAAGTGVCGPGAPAVELPAADGMLQPGALPEPRAG
jgi:hypothetical protein